jgi:hypothetical protein
MEWGKRMSFGPEEVQTQTCAACAGLGPRRWLCRLNPLHRISSATRILRLALLVWSAAGVLAGITLFVAGRPHLVLRVLAGDVAVGIILLLLF